MNQEEREIRWAKTYREIKEDRIRRMLTELKFVPEEGIEKFLKSDSRTQGFFIKALEARFGEEFRVGERLSEIKVCLAQIAENDLRQKQLIDQLIKEFPWMSEIFQEGE